MVSDGSHGAFLWVYNRFADGTKAKKIQTILLLLIPYGKNVTKNPAVNYEGKGSVLALPHFLRRQKE